MGAAALSERRTISWVFDLTIVLAGLVVGAAALVGLLGAGALSVEWAAALLFGAPLIALMSRFPLTLTHSVSGVEIGFESAVLVFLACFAGGDGALAVWTVGQILSQCTTQKRLDIRFFNTGLSILAGAAALYVMGLVSDLDRTAPRELVAVGLGCVTFFAVDYVLSAVSLALEDDCPVRSAMRQNSGLAALGIFVGIDSLGYLAALVVRELPYWAPSLLAVPLATILVATRSLSRGFEHRRRLEALFAAAAEAQVIEDPAGLEELLRRHAMAAVGDRRAVLRDHPAAQGEVGAQVRTGARGLWLVAPARHRNRASIEADRMALEALATVGEETFARLELTEELAHRARHDALTALPNRVLFQARVEEAVRRARTGDAVAVLFLDLDGFKGVNDRFGHSAGDDLLRAVGARLVSAVRAGDTVARLGGDEFAVLADRLGEPGEIDDLCQRLLSTLRADIPIMGHDIVVGASIGVAVALPGETADELLRNADMAMYRAKGLGKDRYFVYEPSLRVENLRRLELVEALRRGVRDELVVHYQPVVDLATGRIGGMEALVRWSRQGELVPPHVFIQAAEESGLITELGERVLARVVEDSTALAEAAGEPISLGVNMSADQLRDPAFLDVVAAAVAALGDNRLILEMTETVVVTDDAETAEVLQRLKALGVRLALDDFGVGFSSVGYLQHLPVDILKIDRTFTREVDTSARAAALVEAILMMGAALGLTVVAEGVEYQTQLAALHQVGCRMGQGFLFSRPVPVEQAARLLTQRRLALPGREPVSGVLG